MKIENRKQRYSCLTREQQGLFDSMNKKQQKYCLYRAQGYNSTDSYRLAGYQITTRGSQNAHILEHRTCPFMPELINAMQGQNDKFTGLVEGGKVAKVIDERANETIEEVEDKLFLQKINSNCHTVEEPFDPSAVSVQQARNIQFYRRIANGTYKTIKKRVTYDKDGKVVSKVVEEESNLETRIRAQKEYMRLVGVSDIVDFTQVEQQNINVMIVDASKKDEKQDVRNLLPNAEGVKISDIIDKGNGEKEYVETQVGESK